MTHIDELSQRAYAYVQPLMANLVQTYSSQGKQFSKEEYDSVFDNLYQKALNAEVRLYDKNAAIDSRPDQKTDIETEYDLNSRLYYQSALNDGKFDFEEMAGMPVELREDAMEYAQKQEEAIFRALYRTERHIAQFQDAVTNILKEDISEEEIQTARVSVFQGFLKSELGRIKTKETERMFGTQN